MKKILVGLLMLFALCPTHAQKGIKFLVQTEKEFAAHSVSYGIKSAFLQFLDSSGWIFDNGKPVNGVIAWNKRADRPGVLNWHPTLAMISISNDLGFTTGPWTYQPTAKDTIIARGQYCTVWHLDRNDQWKFLVDLGANNVPAQDKVTVNSISFHELHLNDNLSSDLFDADNRFSNRNLANGQIAETWEAWYKENLADAAILVRNNRLPAMSPDSISAILKTMPADIHCKIDGIGKSAAADMGYVFGTTVIGGKIDNYLRIWKRTNAGWKLVAEVLRY